MTERKIILKDNKIYLRTSRWIPSEFDDNHVKIKDGYSEVSEQEVTSLAEHLGVEIESVGDNFTFGDLWNIIAKDIDIYNVVFKDVLGGHDLSLYNEDFNKDVELTDKDVDPKNKINYLVVSMTYDYDQSYIDESMKLIRYPDFSGYGPVEEKDTYWAMEFTPLHILKVYPFKVVKKVNINKVGNKRNGYKSENLLDENTTEDITVYDVLNAIFTEITFCGYPEERNEMLDSLKCDVKEIKEKMKDITEIDKLSSLMDGNLSDTDEGGEY